MRSVGMPGEHPVGRSPAMTAVSCWRSAAISRGFRANARWRLLRCARN